MKRITSVFLSSLVVLTGAIMWSCSDNNSVDNADSEQNGTPVITNLLPDSGTPGMTVILQGEYSAKTAEGVQVKFDDQDAQILSVSSYAITAKAPYIAPGTEATVTVDINGSTSNTQSFQYSDATPVISTISMEEGSPGETLTITGTDFGVEATYTTVYFGNQTVEISSIRPTAIDVIIPEGQEGEVVDIFITSNGANSTKIPFKYKSPLPTINSMGPAGAAFGEELTISGQYFSADAEKNQVFFNETGNPDKRIEATIISSSETELKVTIPYLYKENVEVSVVKNGEATSIPQPYSFDLAQCDLAAWNNADWQIEKLREDVEWRNAEFRVFGYEKKVHINVLAITPGAGGIDTKIGIAVKDDGQCQSTSAFGQSLGALAAINGGFFIMDDSSGEAAAYGTAVRSLDHIRIDNQVAVLGRDRRNNGPALPAYINVCMAFDSRNEYEVDFYDLPANKNRNSVAAKEFGEGKNPARSAGGYDYAIAAGPRIITDGTALNRKPDGNEHYDTYRPRTLVGVDADGVIYMVTFDGDSAVEYQGITINNGAYFMKLLGCVNAMSLDGGGSTTMYIKDKGKVSDVTNNSYERPVANVLYVK